MRFHPRRSFRCRSRLPCDPPRASGALAMLVAVQLSVLGLYLPPVFKGTRLSARSAPDDHFAAGPDCRVSSGSRCVGRAGGCPTIRAGIVSPAGVRRPVETCHPRRSFHCQSRLRCGLSGSGRIGGLWPSNCLCWDCISRRCSRSR